MKDNGVKQTTMDSSDGWMDFHDPYRVRSDHPARHAKIWIWRDGWDKPTLTRYDDMHPMTNMIGLRWKPAA
jgi:hypothetical protein